MSKKPFDARNTEFLQKEVKKLKKQSHSQNSDAIALLQSVNPGLSGLTPDQIGELHIPQYAYQAAVAHQFGFSSWVKMIAYANGRPRREGGGIVISEEAGLTLLEALNKRAALHTMPPIGTKITNKHGIEWVIANYEFYRTPTTFARYPRDCDYLPVLSPPVNVSQRLKDFMCETDRCTSKRIVFIDTMPVVHPFDLGKDIHCANFGGYPAESYIFLDAARAHETTIAHELAHLWLIYVQGGDDGRVLRDRTDDRKVNQLDFLQSFVLDLKVNDLIAERGFDMSLINADQINGLTMLRDAVVLGHEPPTSWEALLNCLSIAAPILEQKRWPSEMRHRLNNLLEFFELAAPGLRRTAQAFVEIVDSHGYDSREAIRKVLDECITLGFRATGDDFNLERDLQPANLHECMQDKYPEQFAGWPVPLKLEIGKTMARHGISGEGRVWLSASPTGMAQVIIEHANGTKIGPLPVKYQLIPPHLTMDYTHLQRPTRCLEGANTADEIKARLHEDMGINRPPVQFATQALANGMVPDDFGRLPCDPGYNTCYPPGQHPSEQMAAAGLVTATTGTPTAMKPWEATQSHAGVSAHAALQHRVAPQSPIAFSANPATSPYQRLQHPHNPMQPEPPSTDITRRYMAGVGLSVARARLAEQVAQNGGNLYQYANNNPVICIRSSGDTPQTGFGGTSGTIGYILAEFINNTCGLVQLWTYWSGVPCKEGWVIQHVTADEKQWSCYHDRPQRSDHYEFWEAVKISCGPGGGVEYYPCGQYKDLGVSDLFQPSPMSGVGHVRMIGHTKFLPHLPPSATGWAMGKVPQAGCNFATYGPISGWTDPGPAKLLDVDYDCCDCSHEWDVVHKP